MIRSRVVTLDTSGTAADGSVAVPPSRYSGMYYQFDDSTQRATITIRNLGRVVQSVVDADNDDGAQDVALTSQELVSGQVVVNATQITNGTAGDELTVNLYFDFG